MRPPTGTLFSASVLAPTFQADALVDVTKSGGRRAAGERQNVREIMKSTIFALTAIGLVLGFSAPTIAEGSKKPAVTATAGSMIVTQKDKCKKGEVWDEATKKCKKK